MEKRAMDSERWQKVERLYHAVLECEENQRAAFLTRACEGDATLRREIESLVSYESRSGKFIEGSALEIVAPALAGDGGEEQAPPAESRMIGKRICQYRLVEQLGSGGMGEVYRAVRADDQYQKQVAIKLVRAGADSGLVINRFKNERQILASLDHPNIARLLDGGATEEGVPYFVMELVEGQPIDKYCDSDKLGIRARLELFLQVCSAVKYSHRHQIIHRDIKPANILVNAEGVPKLLDFGIAKILESGVLAGVKETQTMFRVFTPEYASPEQIKAEAVTTASDVYSLGVLLYELLTGHRPYRFKTRTPSEIEQAICGEEPLKPSAVVRRVEEQALADDTTVSITPGETRSARNTDPKQIRRRLLGDLDAIVMMALRKEPKRRYASVDDLSEDIRKHLEGLPIAARPSTLAYRGVKFIRRHKELALGALAFTALLGSLVTVRHSQISKQSSDPHRNIVRRQLTANAPGNPVSSAAISRDGKYLAYSDTSSKMYFLQIDSGDLRQLPFSGFDPLDWFPDGNHLLVTGTGQRSGLWKISVSDGSSRKLTSSVDFAVLSVNGLQVAYEAGNEIWIMGPDGQEARRIAKFDAIDSIGWIAWSPSGQRLVYTRSRGESLKMEVVIETCDLQGGRRTLVLSEPRLSGPNGVSGIYWLPDGRILYSVSRTGESLYSDRNFWAVATDPWSGKPLGAPIRLGDDAQSPGNLQASADGKRLIYTYSRSSDAAYLGDLELGAMKFNPRRLTLEEWNNWPFDWTRDSTAVLFASIRNGRYAIFQQRIDQQTPQVLLSGAENYRRPIFSPAADRLLYLASATVDYLDPTKRVMSKPVNEGTPSVLVAGAYYYRCGSVPSARCVLAELQGQQLVFSELDPVKGKGAEIQRVDVHRGDWSVAWSISPDGNKIAIVDPGGNRGEVKILTVADHEVGTLALQGWKWDEAQSIAWSADGNHLFATAATGTSFVLCSIDLHGKMQVLAEVPQGEAWLSYPVPSPDGHHLAYMKRTFENNVMMLDHF
jgi:serine/threonine protein kinase